MFSIIIINYRQKKHLFDCVASISENLNTSDYEIIIVNNSPEVDISELLEKYNTVRIINSCNNGFAYANNLAVKISEGEYLFFLNPDTILRDNVLSNFIKYFSSKNFGAVGFKLLYPDNVFQISFGFKNNLRNEKKNKYYEKKFNEKYKEIIEKVESLYSDVKEVDWVSGAAMIIRKSVFKEIGGFNEKYFLYYEDADICERLNNAGYKNYFFPYSSIIHFKGENTNKKFNESTYFYSKESQLVYYSLHNNLLQNVLLRVYLFVKFFIKYLFTFNKINLIIISAVFKSYK
jgi:GT2 family glycosyltransferase